jgi:hypothetical protein
VTWLRRLNLHDPRCRLFIRKPCTRLGCWAGTSPLFTQRGHTSSFSQPYAPHDDEEPEARVGKVLRLLEEPTIYFARDPDWQQWYRALDPVHGEPPPVDETISDLAERELAVLRMPQLILERMKLDLLSKSLSPPVGARE